jgi:nucleotide-binding universal stress UspA family protein
MQEEDRMLATAQTEVQQAISFKRILIATDFSDASQRAQAWGLAVACRYGSEVYLVHATPREARGPVPMDPLPKEIDRRQLEAEGQMKVLADEVRATGIASHTIVKHDSVLTVIPSLIQEESIDLLVLGTHGRGGLKKLVLGSVAEELLRLVSCPVLTVGRNAESLTGSRTIFGRILFATDFGAGAANALRYALFLAEEQSTSLVLLHMVPPMPAIMGPEVYAMPSHTAEELTEWEASQRQESTRKLKQILRRGTELVFKPEYVVKTGFLPEGILGVAAEHKVGLIVMGANRTGSPHTAAHMPWTIVHHVLSEAKCPVLTVMA